MTRALKQFIYGSGYAALLFLIAFGIWNGTLKEPATCTDGIRNQNEIAVDCGGPCVSCVIKNLLPLREAGEPRVLSLTDGRAVALFEVKNPNTTHHANSFSYDIVVRDLNKVKLESFSGTDTLFAGETRMLFEPKVSARANNIGSIELIFKDPEWRAADEFVPPSLVLSDIATEKDGGTVRVSGTVRNESALIAREVRVLAIVYDQFGYELFASQTKLTAVGGFTETPFSVPFPQDEGLSGLVDGTATKVFVYSR